ncbi:MAG: hypothetical protein JXB24_07320 [Bacteroidales bacterium]|nr:hypothetical protein [Bacteroidales bacterium]
MTDHILVCPFNKKLLDKIKHNAIIIRTRDFKDLHHIHREVNKSNALHAIKIQTETPLATISFQESWLHLPLVIYSPEFGDYKDFSRQLDLIRKLNIRIFLSSQHEFNFTGLRILSSLNISCGLFFNEEPPNWDLLNDLMHYDIYGRTRHAPIEPFHWLASHYEPAGYTDYNSVYFNNPLKYFHINEKEQIALTETDLLNNNYIDEGIKTLDTIEKNKKYIDFLNRRYEIMLQMNECAFCPAFRICLAKFQNLTDKKNTCKSFFSDFMDAADYYFSKRNTIRNQLWQL